VSRQGHFENSPAFERRGLAVLPTSPIGTTENSACRVAALAKTGVSTVPAGLDFFQPVPALKCRAILDCFFGTERLHKK